MHLTNREFYDIPYIVIDEYYNDSELDLIWEELEFFTYSHKLKDPETTQEAYHGAKKNSGLFLDQVWSGQRELSNILTINRKIFNELDILRQNPSWFFKHFECTSDTTLLSYYEDGGYYKPHRDNFAVTMLSWFYKKPKVFEGGNLRFHMGSDFEEITVVNNRTVIFPSCLIHSVTPIFMEDQYQRQKLGRYCLTQFLRYQDLANSD